MRTDGDVRALTAGAAPTGKRAHRHRAALLDAHTAARRDTARIGSLVADLLAAHGEWPPVSR